MQVALEGIELRLIQLPLAESFRAAHGRRDHREVVVVRALVADGPDGWAECVAEVEPTYWPEYTAGALHVLQHHLVPRMLAGKPLRDVRGHQMAKAALEGAVLDAGLRAEKRSLASFLGARRREVGTGIALGITDTVDDLVMAAMTWCARGHRALKLKVAPGWDLDPVRAVRAAVGQRVDLVVDANGSYRSDDPSHVAVLTRLAEPALGLATIEQPFAPDDLTGHARLAELVSVPICLDESIGSLADVETALALGACGAVNLKVGRVGGLLETRRIHERCVAEGLPLRAGGMLETGLGRAVNLAVAALPGCTLPPDLGPSARYFTQDITPAFDDRDGTMAVPDGAGLGIEPLQEVLDDVTVNQLTLRTAR
ncbi:MAG TPA: o-succinylbenzoate synthase [Acidimicrobiales bacterium]|jgi:o-succinylbenzoate synthase|nr:o-succinylbenzoate synthase [Acidimicrobiales bacterium]